MNIIDRDGETIIQVRQAVIEVTKENLTPAQTAERVAQAYGHHVWWFGEEGEVLKRARPGL